MRLKKYSSKQWNEFIFYYVKNNNNNDNKNKNNVNHQVIIPDNIIFYII